MSNDDTPSSLREAAKRKERRFNKSWREEREQLKDDLNELEDEIKGNPKVVEAIRKLERRIELLEEKLD